MSEHVKALADPKAASLVESKDPGSAAYYTATLDSNRNMAVVPEKPRRQAISNGKEPAAKNIPCDFHRRRKKKAREN
jgi:hypothetical protein